MNKKIRRIVKIRKQQILISATVVSFAILGIILVQLGNGATSAIAIEAENGSASGSASVIDNAAASGGKAARFDVDGTTPPPPLAGKRIAYSADGNQHDDDDWAATPMMLAILAHEKKQANLVHLDYNDHIWDSSAQGPNQMRTSVNGAVQRWGFNASNVFDDLTQYDASTANLVEEINKSTATDQLWFSLAGPMETAYRAMAAANPSARQHVKCVSHGDWNETHGADDHRGRSYNDLIGLGCQRVEIIDQNPRIGSIADISVWHFLRDSPNADYKWLYTRIQQPTESLADISDSGMVWFTLFGSQTVTRTDIKNLLLAP